MNNSTVTRKFRFHLIAILTILVGLFSDLHLISAQSARVAPADQNARLSIRIGTDGSVTSVTSVTSIPGDSNYMPIRTVAPQYPPRAAQRGITGWNLVGFSVNEDGNVDEGSIVIVDSEPQDIFDRSSIVAASQLKFRPLTVNGAKVGINEVQYLFMYELNGGGVVPGRRLKNREYLPLNYITPHYPLAAREENVEGYVLVEFTITKQGMPAGIVILDRSPSNIFNASAINAAERFRFDPRIMDGEPVEAEGARYLFNFKP